MKKPTMTDVIRENLELTHSELFKKLIEMGYNTTKKSVSASLAQQRKKAGRTQTKFADEAVRKDNFVIKKLKEENKELKSVLERYKNDVKKLIDGVAEVENEYFFGAIMGIGERLDIILRKYKAMREQNKKLPPDGEPSHLEKLNASLEEQLSGLKLKHEAILEERNQAHQKLNELEQDLADGPSGSNIARLAEKRISEMKESAVNKYALQMENLRGYNEGFKVGIKEGIEIRMEVTR